MGREIGEDLNQGRSWDVAVSITSSSPAYFSVAGHRLVVWWEVILTIVNGLVVLHTCIGKENAVLTNCEACSLS